MKEHMNDINGAVELHTELLKRQAKIMIKRIKENTGNCIGQLKKIVNIESIQKVKIGVDEKIRLIKCELDLLDNKKSKYNELSIIEKLKMPKIENSQDVILPNLEEIITVINKLKVVIDYEDAILNMNLPIK